jgi:hypothetical protein
MHHLPWVVVSAMSMQDSNSGAVTRNATTTEKAGACKVHQATPGKIAAMTASVASNVGLPHFFNSFDSNIGNQDADGKMSDGDEDDE